MTTVIYPFSYFWDWSKRLHWAYLLSFVLIGVILYYRSSGKERKGLLSFLFPRSHYWSRDFLTDCGFVYLGRLFFLFVTGPLYVKCYGLGKKWGTSFGKGMNDLLPDVALGNSVKNVIYSICFFVVLDFCVFIVHYFQHKIPLLWEFHKVHHSAKTMTPLTVFRMHPVDYILNFTVSGTLLGLTSGLMVVLLGGMDPYLVLGNNVFVVIGYFVGFNLRHSHLWLDYGPHLSGLFISPAMHQVHHSSAKKHWDKNFGFLLSGWDRIVGTLYIPHKKEQLKLGLSDGTTEEYQSVWRLYFLPFFKLFKK